MFPTRTDQALGGPSPQPKPAGLSPTRTLGPSPTLADLFPAPGECLRCRPRIRAIAFRTGDTWPMERVSSKVDRERQTWNELADMDPFWAALTRHGRPHSWNEVDFFATGPIRAGRAPRSRRAARWAGNVARLSTTVWCRAHDAGDGRSVRDMPRGRRLRADDRQGEADERRVLQLQIRGDSRWRLIAVGVGRFRLRLLGTRAATRGSSGDPQDSLRSSLGYWRRGVCWSSRCLTGCPCAVGCSQGDSGIDAAQTRRS